MEYNYQQIKDPATGGIYTDGILRLPGGASIPNDLQNTDWQQYQVWLSQGNVPLPPEGN